MYNINQIWTKDTYIIISYIIELHVCITIWFIKYMYSRISIAKLIEIIKSSLTSLDNFEIFPVFFYHPSRSVAELMVVIVQQPY